MVSCVVFDFDGTLVDSNPIKRGAYVDIFEEVVPKHQVDAWKQLVKRTVREHDKDDRFGVIGAILHRAKDAGLDHSLPENSAHEHIDVLAARYNEICKIGAGTCAEMPGAVNLLDRLRSAKIEMHINTGTPLAAIKEVLGMRGWLHYFASVHGRESGKTGALNQIMIASDLPSSEVVMVGDDDADIIGAREAGCRSIGFRHATSKVTLEPDRTITGLAQIESILTEWGAPNLERVGQTHA